MQEDIHQQFEQKDRDLLVELRTEMRNLIKRFDDLNNSTVRDVADLRATKLDKDAFNSYKSEVDREHQLHESSDEKLFTGIDEKIKAISLVNVETSKKLVFHDRAIWIGMTIVAFLQFAAPYIIDQLRGKQ